MRRRIIAIFAVLLALGSPPAQAQFAISPRGIFGLMTRPLRDMLGHLRGQYFHRHGHEPARQAGHNEAKEQGPPGVKAALAERTTEPGRSVLNAFDDVLGYAFWPKEYAGRLDRYGYDAIAVAVIGPLPPALATEGRAATTGQNGQSGETGSVVPACGPAVIPTTDWMSEQFSQRLPDATKLHSYDTLLTKVSQGANSIEANCRTVQSSSPVARLAAFRARLWAVHDAGVLARHSLKTFYDALPDKEKREFDNPGQVTAKSGNGDAAASRQRECVAHSAGATGRMLSQIQQTVRPRPGQQANLNGLRKTSEQMEKLVLALCARQPAKTPLERLDAANERLVTMNFAAANVQVALNVFYASLDPTQKAKLDSLTQ